MTTIDCDAEGCEKPKWAYIASFGHVVCKDHLGPAVSGEVKWKRPSVYQSAGAIVEAFPPGSHGRLPGTVECKNCYVSTVVGSRDEAEDWFDQHHCVFPARSLV